MKFRAILPVLIFCLLLLGTSACTNVFFQPLKPHLHTPEELLVEYDEIWIESDPGLSLQGWLMHGNQPRKGRILFLHGNGENISTHFASVYWLTRYGYDVFLFDYRGYGQSQGVAELDGVLRDVNAMINYVARQGDEQEAFFVLGHSLGGALALTAVAQSAEKLNITAVVSVAAFSSYQAIASDVLSRSWITWAFQWLSFLLIDDTFSPDQFVAGISPVPVLIMHSKQDQTIPFEHSQQLFELAKQPKQFIEITGDHNVFFDVAENRQQFLNYLDSYAEQQN